MFNYFKFFLFKLMIPCNNILSSALKYSLGNVESAFPSKNEILAKIAYFIHFVLSLKEND